MDRQLSLSPKPSSPSPSFSPPVHNLNSSPSQSFPPPFPSAFPSSASSAAQAQILQLQAQILQLQAQILLSPASSSTSPEMLQPSRFRSVSASPSAHASPLSPSPSKPHVHSSPMYSNSLSLPHSIVHANPAPRLSQPLVRHPVPPPRPPPPPPRTPSQPRLPSTSDDDSHFRRQRACSTGEILSEAELVLQASRKSYEQRLKDLDQYRAQLKAEALLMPHSLPVQDKPLDPYSKPSPPLSCSPPQLTSQPSMSDIAAKVLSVLHASESRSSLPMSDSRADTDSLDDVQSLGGSCNTDDEHSISSQAKDSSPAWPSREDTQHLGMGTIKGGNLLKKAGLRGWSKRYVLLNPTSLAYYQGSVLKKSLPLTGDSEVKLGPGAEFVVIDDNKKETHFATASETERRDWISAIQDVIEADKKSRRYETKNGELKLQLWFEEEKFTLHVTVMCARGLKRKTKKVNAYNNPYVKLRILPPQSKNCQTRVIKSCVDPTWDESFHFRLERSTLTVQTLRLKVKNDETGTDTLFGELLVPLLNVSFDEREPTCAWYPLQDPREKKEEAPVGRERAFSERRPQSSGNPFHAGGDLSSMSSADFQPQRMSPSDGSLRKLGLESLDDEVVAVGTLRATVWYDTESEMLKVDVLECHLYKAKAHFVEMRLLPAEAGCQPLRTKVHKDDVFSEKFEMPLVAAKVTFSTLSFVVKDRRTTFGKSKDLGEFVLPLDRIPRTSAGAMQTHWLNAPSTTIFELHTLGDILMLEAGYQSFLITVAKEHSTENLLFWKQVQDFRHKYLDAAEDQRQSCMAECLQICSKYVDVGAELEINVPPSMKDTIRAQIRGERQASHGCETLAGIFDRVQAEVLDLMSRDSFARYLASQEWLTLSKLLQQESTEKELGFKVVNLVMDFGYVNRAREAMVEQRQGKSPLASSRSGIGERFRRLPDALQRDIISPPRQLRRRVINTKTFT